MTDPTRDRQIDVIAAALANSRGGRNGIPSVKNVLEMLSAIAGGKLVREVREDADLAVTALEAAGFVVVRREIDHRIDRVLLLASYCGDDNAECTEQLPCAKCLDMCNIVTFSGRITANHGGYDANKEKITMVAAAATEGRR